MTAQDLVPFIIGLYSFIFALFLALFGGGWWLRGRLIRVESGLARIGHLLSTELDIVKLMMLKLGARGIMTGDDLMEILQLLFEHHDDDIRRVVREEERTNNPLDEQGLEKLKHLISKARAEEVLSWSEVEEFNALVSKLKEGKDKTDPGIVALVTIGDLLGALKSASPKNSVTDPTLAELWDNEKDAEYDQI